MTKAPTDTVTGPERTTTVRILRALAGVAVACGLALGWAGPARADQLLEGVYTYTQDGLGPLSWTIYPSCVPVVGDLREPLSLPVGCRLHIQSSPGATGGDARLTDRVWTYTTSIREGIVCPDGGWAPTTETYRFDDAAMSGTRTVFNTDVCGLRAGKTDVPFTLAFKEPLPFPVEHYPLGCDPGGLRRCR